MQYVEWQENRVSPNFECRQSNENMRLSHWCENRISILINDNILRCVRRKNLLFSLPDTKKYPRCRRVNGNSECWTEIQASCASRLVRHVRFVISFLPLFPRNNKFRISNGKWFTRRVRRRGLVARRVIYMLCFFFFIFFFIIYFRRFYRSSNNMWSNSNDSSGAHELCVGFVCMRRYEYTSIVIAVPRALFTRDKSRSTHHTAAQCHECYIILTELGPCIVPTENFLPGELVRFCGNINLAFYLFGGISGAIFVAVSTTFAINHFVMIKVVGRLQCEYLLDAV